MKSPTDVVSGFILLGLCGVGAYSVATLPDAGGMEHVGPGAFPAGILVLLTALSLVLIVQGFRRSPVKVYWPESKVFKKILVFIGLFYLYLVTLTGLGELFLNMENPPFQRAFFCDGNGNVKNILKSSCQPTREKSVPLYEIK